MTLAVQLYTLRERLALDLEATLAALAETGAREVELAGLYGRDPAAMREALDAAGLAACSSHVKLERFDEPGLYEEAAALGTELLVVPSVPEPADAAAADAVVERLVAASARTNDAGYGFAYHNHTFEFGPHELWERIVASGIDLEPDVGWLRVAGRDPVAVLGELEGRCPLVHAKDVRRDGDGWRDVPAGDGELDWPAIAAAAPHSRLIVELDNPSEDPLDDIARSLATLRDL